MFAQVVTPPCLEPSVLVVHVQCDPPFHMVLETSLELTVQWEPGASELSSVASVKWYTCGNIAVVTVSITLSHNTRTTRRGFSPAGGHCRVVLITCTSACVIGYVLG